MLSLKKKQQQLRTSFVTIATKTDEQYWTYWLTTGLKKNSVELKTIQVPNRQFSLILQQ